MAALDQFTGSGMEVFIESVSAGGTVTGRVVLQGRGFVKEIARLNLTQAHWEDFTRCLLGPARIDRGRIVFAPVRKVTREPTKESDAPLTAYLAEAVA